jgi:hypothetical protein
MFNFVVDSVETTKRQVVNGGSSNVSEMESSEKAKFQWLARF